MSTPHDECTPQHLEFIQKSKRTHSSTNKHSSWIHPLQNIDTFKILTQITGNMKWQGLVLLGPEGCTNSACLRVFWITWPQHGSNLRPKLFVNAPALWRAVGAAVDKDLSNSGFANSGFSQHKPGLCHIWSYIEATFGVILRPHLESYVGRNWKYMEASMAVIVRPHVISF